MSKSDEIEYHDPEFMAAFNEDAPAGDAGGDEPGGMDLAGEVQREGADADGDTPAAEAAEEAAGGGDGDEAAPAAVVVVVEEQAQTEKVKPSAEVKDQPTEGEQEAAAAAGKDAKAQAAQEEDPELADVPPEDKQKAKSWMGRLKAREAELAKREEALKAKPAAKAEEGGEQDQQAAAAAIQQAADQAAASGNKEQAERAAEVAQQVADGEITAEEGRKQLAEDFGDEFVQHVDQVAKRAAREALKSIKTVDPEELAKTKAELEALRNQAAIDHYEAIAEAHPDFVKVYEDPAFRKWAHDNGKDAIVDNGSARQINKMLDQYKAAKPAAAKEQPAPAKEAAKPAKVDQEALEAAEAVSGGGGGARLPEKPAKANDDFASAFDEFE